MASGTQTPSLDWPTRVAALTGNELLLKQNKAADATAAPKEELVPTYLLLNYILNNLPEDDYVQSAVLVGSTLRLTRVDGTILNVDLSSLGNDDYVSSANLNGSVLELNRLGGATVSVNLASLGGGGSGPIVYNNGSDFLFKSFGSGITGTKLAGTATITVPNDVTLQYLRINGDTSDLNPSNEFIIRIVHSGNTGDGYSTINDDLAGLYIPSHIGILDRSIDSVSPPPAASDPTPYVYNVGSVSKAREIISVGSGTIDIRLLNMNSFLEWSVVLGF